MKKLFLFAFCLITLVTLKAQTWCPPGAQWHFRIYQPVPNDYRDGYLQLNNIGTVTINSIICNDLQGLYTGSGTFPWSPTVTASNIVNIKTYQNNNVVYIYNNSINSFDTLANFSANPGDKWRKMEFPNPPPSSACTYPRPKITVIDTGHVTINNQYLKKLIITHPYGNSTFMITDTIIEKIACITTFLFPYYHCINDGPLYGNFVCYSDNNFSLYKKAGVTTPCNYTTVGLNEYNNSLFSIFIYPNPINDILNIETKDLHSTEKSIIKITDPLGRIVLETEYTKQINIKELKPGIYFLQIYDKEKLVATKKIVKD